MSEALGIANVRVVRFADWVRDGSGYGVAIDAKCDGDDSDDWRYFDAVLPDAVLTVDCDEYGDWSLAADVSGIEWTEYVDGEPGDVFLLDESGADLASAAIGESALADYLIDLTIARIEDSHAEARAWGTDLV